MNDNGVFQELVSLLKENHLTVCAAESCTAGLFSSSVAEVPGASDVMGFGFVTYSVKAKNECVGVPFETVDRFGVVSEETALAMAKGALERSGADVGLGITGFAGPTSDGTVPVGRVCFGYSVQGVLSSETVDFGDAGRNDVRRNAVLHAARSLIKQLESENEKVQ